MNVALPDQKADNANLIASFVHVNFEGDLSRLFFVPAGGLSKSAAP